MDSKYDDIELRSEDVQDIISYIPNWMIRFGNVIIFLLLGFVVFSTFLIKFPDTIRGQIIITTSVPPAHLVSKSEGKISNLFVKENDFVNEHQVLATLESTADYKDIKNLKDALMHLDIEETECTDLDFELNNLGEVQDDFLYFKEAWDAHKMQLSLYPEEREAAAITNQISEYRSLAQKQLVQKQNFKQELEIAELDLKRTEDLFKEKVLAPKEYEELQKQYLKLNREFDDLNIFSDNTKISISELEKELILLEIKEKQIVESLRKSLIEKYRTLKNAIAEWEQQYAIKSPINGNISFFKYWSTNQFVEKGEEIFTVVPSTENNKLIGKLTLPIKNSGKVKFGQEVNICIDSYPCDEFGKVKGIINSVSLVPKEGNYAIEVSLNSLVTSYHKPLEFKQEMQGTARIITEDLRLIDRLINFFRSLKVA